MLILLPPAPHQWMDLLVRNFHHPLHIFPPDQSQMLALNSSKFCKRNITINYKIVYFRSHLHQIWLKVASEFEAKWNYPCCIGAIDGKHIAIQQPSYTGSKFFNYKHFFSVRLVALVDANYKFIYVDIGAAGRAGDAGVYGESTLKEAIASNSINIPPPTYLKGNSAFQVNYHIVGDDAFPMSNNLMKPYPHRNLARDKQIFNYRLSRARRVVENAFGILAHRWRVFLTTIKMCPDKLTYVIFAACCLHNYLVEKNKSAYISVMDVENAD